MFTYTNMCTRTYKHTCTHTFKRTCTCTCTRTCTHACTRIRMYMHTSVHMYMHIHANVHAHKYVHVHIHAHVHATPPPSYICHMPLWACAVVLYPRIIPLFSGMLRNPCLNNPRVKGGVRKGGGCLRNRSAIQPRIIHNPRIIVGLGFM
jgi:hypothetical protein